MSTNEMDRQCVNVVKARLTILLVHTSLYMVAQKGMLTNGNNMLFSQTPVYMISLSIILNVTISLFYFAIINITQ
jgi:hypothetical protein